MRAGTAWSKPLPNGKPGRAIPALEKSTARHVTGRGVSWDLARPIKSRSDGSLACLKRDDAEIAVAGNCLRARADGIDLECLQPFQIAGLGKLNDAGELVAKPRVRRCTEIRRFGQLAFAGRGFNCRALAEGSLRCGGAFRTICRRLSRGIGGELCIAGIGRGLSLPLHAPRKAVLRLHDFDFVGLVPCRLRGALSVELLRINLHRVLHM